jgi:ankyrin repeat protein
MKLLITTIAAVFLVGCGKSQQSTPPAEAKPAEPVAEAAQPEPTTAKAPAISIHEAAKEGNIEAVKQRLAAVTDVNAKDKWDITPLHYAAQRGHKEIAELLISKGADVNAKGEDGTPLDWAIQKQGSIGFPGQQEEIVELQHLLRKHGGKTGEELKGGEPVAEASQPKPSIVKPAGISIHDAAEKGNIEVVKKHLADGVDMNAKDKHGGTPLHRAALGGDKEIVELLITRGADVNTKSVSGGTALYVAVFNGRREITQLLIAKGADVNSKDNRGGTSLHSAAWHGHKEIAELLIAEGADVNSKGDVNGGTPLHIAAFRDQKETAKLLIAKGADVNAKMVSGAKKGNTPLDAANETENTDIADLLRKHGGKTGEELKAEGK